ncbi:hypothetical protein [Cellulomonas soli]|uniref:Uncharacterized protein n=1 Tax=Cellulomonas soli TaxID=931535 RepID=A0A512P8J0_9CELL|nr:hypothetical protein [Cellulomonas soli]NYI57742.1 hypothetical protein [Cellulomonas soli]GEP67523.1 hypothetical protein CSO01_02380 [Cellulomonas soli]
MGVVFDGVVWTSYAQLTVTTDLVGTPSPDEAFVSQVNGLCGAAVAGGLFLITGTHTGQVPVRVSVLDTAPSGLGEWDEVVEVNLRPATRHAALSGWADDPAVRFDLPADSYRVRWCASGMDAGHAQDVADDEHPAPDHYELMLWPEAPAADSIIRRTSAQAAYWHERGFTRSR